MALDPKEVLQHLNKMGYKNITAKQLKEFMKDLRKLITTESRNRCEGRDKNYMQELRAQDCLKNSEHYPKSITQKPCSRPCSRSSSHNKRIIDLEEDEKKLPKPKMWIKTSKPTTRKPCDPLQLYQKYQREWEKHKQYIPGENDHAELRWQIRHRLLGS